MADRQYKWIVEGGQVEEEALAARLRPFAGCSCIAFYVDGPVAGGVLTLDAPPDAARLLELRAFDGTRELWLHRSALKVPFHFRVACDEGLDEADWFDEQQLLDDNGEAGPFRASGGGVYSLPVEKREGQPALAVVLRHYIRYSEETGRAELCDFRILGFREGETA